MQSLHTKIHVSLYQYANKVTEVVPSRPSNGPKLLRVPTIVCKTFGKRAAMASNCSLKLVLAGGAMFGTLGRAQMLP